MKSAALTTIKGGINRLRLKGGARADTLYDALNCYVSESGTVIARPGSVRIAELDPLTRGLMYFNAVFHTFCHTFVEVPSGFRLHVLVHPAAVPSDDISLERIHFAEPYLGALYVVAEFDDGSVFHYWLQEPTEWEANKIYANGALVEPVAANGLTYRASRLGPPFPSWAPGVARSDGDGSTEQSIVEPTVYNDFYYTCVDATGSNPVSGTVEPTWPLEDGAQVIEETDNGPGAAPTTTSPPTTQEPQAATTERYGRYVLTKSGVRWVEP